MMMCGRLRAGDRVRATTRVAPTRCPECPHPTNRHGTWVGAILVVARRVFGRTCVGDHVRATTRVAPTRYPECPHPTNRHGTWVGAPLVVARRVFGRPQGSPLRDILNALTQQIGTGLGLGRPSWSPAGCSGDHKFGRPQGSPLRYILNALTQQSAHTSRWGDPRGRPPGMRVARCGRRTLCPTIRLV